MTLPEIVVDPSGVQHRDGGLGTLATQRGNLPLRAVAATVGITGLVARTVLTQEFQNPHDVPLEATYIFPLPDRAAVAGLTLTAADHTIRAELKERGQARREYDEAVAAGQRAAIAEEERPDVFTLRVGNILPGETVTVMLTLVGPLSYEDGEGTYRLPLVVAPRYIPGSTVETAAGSGWAADTDAVPDASRITPPVLLPGFPNPVRLSIDVDVDPAGLPLEAVRSTLHAVRSEGSHLSIRPGERVDRDFVLRLTYGQPEAAPALTVSPDDEGTGGTFRLTLLPPTSAAPARPRDVVLVLDRSGSMHGWKMVAARRAAARIVDTLTTQDRFAVIAFDNELEEPTRPGPGLHEASDRNRYAAVEFLSKMEARGGTELLAPLQRALALLTDQTRDRVLVLVTDGQVGNEDQLVRLVERDGAGLRVHTVGIDRAVNAGFLGRLAGVGGGRCELVESEDRLDEAMAQIHRRIGAAVVTGLSLATEGLRIDEGTVTPARLPDLFPGAPLVVTGRYLAAQPGATATVAGRTRPGEAWSARAVAVTVPTPSLSAIWARAHLLDLVDRFVSEQTDPGLEHRIVATSLRFGVLCRFTAWVAVDERVVTEGGQLHRVLQPVELPSGWESPALIAPRHMTFAASTRMLAAPAAGRVGHAKIAADGLAAPAPAPAPEVRRDGAGLAETAAREARRLRESAGAPEWERRELLADLGTRLAAELTQGEDRLRALVAELAEDRLAALAGDALAQLWDRTLALLEELSAGGGSLRV